MKAPALPVAANNTPTVPVAVGADLWLATVDHVTVHKTEAVFTFKGGMEITEEI